MRTAAALVRFIVAFAAGIVPGASLVGAEPPPVQVVGIQVMLDFPGKGPLFQPAAGDTGTTIHLLVSGVDLVAVDLSASAITALVDDQRKDLLAAHATPPSGGFDPFPRIADDRRAALVAVRSRELPSPHASAVTVVGSLRVRSGRATAVRELGHLALGPGAVIPWGTAGKKLTVESLAGRTLSVTTDDDLADLVRLSCVDEAGVEHVADQRSSASFGAGGTRTTTLDYDIEGLAPVMDVRVTAWSDLATRDVPFTVVATLSGR